MKQTANYFHKFLLLWTGELVSAIGSGLTSFGLGVYVFQQTGMASATALVTLLAFAPGLILGVPAGVLADRYDRRLLMILGDGLSALGLLFILFCLSKGEAALWQICVGVTISSVFSSLLDPAYKATVTDLLTPEQYTKASGLVGVAGSAKYLISPVLAGLLLTISDIRLLLLLDTATFFLTVTATLVVRKGIDSRKTMEKKSFTKEFSEGWNAITQKKGVLVLVILSSAITFFLGFIQTLFGPMILGFADSTVLGVSETICASGMLISSLVIGTVSLKKNRVVILSAALFAAGIFMAGFGIRENIVVICTFGFLFFSSLPFANAALDFLVRTNIADDFQGRAWGLIGVLSQLGYVAAYAVSGILADGTGALFSIGSGRGSGLLIVAAGIFLAAISFLPCRIKSVRALEETR